MRRLRKNQLKYGFISGIFTFGFLWLISSIFMLESNISNWRASLILLLHLHFIPISPGVDITTNIQIEKLRIIPFLIFSLACGYSARKIAYTKNIKYILENASMPLIGYLPAFSIAYSVSNINPVFEWLIFIFVMPFIAFYIGSQFISKFSGSLPFIGIVSLGSVIYTGLIILIFGLSIIIEFSGLIFVIVFGISIGSSINYYSRNGFYKLYNPIKENSIIIILFLLLCVSIFMSLNGIPNTLEILY